MKKGSLPAALFAAVLGFYVYTLQPSLSWGDGARLQREAITGESFILSELVKADFAYDPLPFARLGVAAWDHPLWVMIAHALVRALPFVNSLWLANLVSAVFGAAAITALYLLCEARTHSAIASLAAALALAVSHTFWFHATTPEVYSLFAFLLLLSLLLFDHYERTQKFTALIAGVFVFGLAAADHLLAFLAIPAVGAYFFLTLRERAAPAAKIAAASRPYILLAGVFLLGFSPYWIQFARMLRTFPMTQLMRPAVGETFLRGLLRMTPPLFGQSILNYLIFLILQFGPLGVIVGLYGFWKGSQASTELWKKVAAFYGIYTTFGILYRVSDQFAFFLTSHIFFAIAIGLGTARIGAITPPLKRGLLVGGMCLSIAAMPPLYQALPGLLRQAGVGDATFGIPQIGTGYRDGLAFYINPNKRGDEAAYRFGRDTLAALPPNSVVIAEWYTDTDEYFVLRYFELVEHLRADVELVAWPLEDIERFDSSIALKRVADEIQTRPVYLASLDERFYAASALAREYCIVPESNLYRVYLRNRAHGGNCIEIVNG